MSRGDRKGARAHVLKKFVSENGVDKIYVRGGGGE